MKMAAKRHKFKLYLLSQQISARTIQRYIHNWFHHQGSHFLSNHPAVTVISLNNCTNPPNSPISHNNSPNENNTTPSYKIFIIHSLQIKKISIEELSTTELPDTNTT